MEMWYNGSPLDPNSPLAHLIRSALQAKLAETTGMGDGDDWDDDDEDDVCPCPQCMEEEEAEPEPDSVDPEKRRAFAFVEAQRILLTNMALNKEMTTNDALMYARQIELYLAHGLVTAKVPPYNMGYVH